MFSATPQSISKVPSRFSAYSTRRLLSSQAASIKPWVPATARRRQWPVVHDPPSDPKGVTGVLSNWVKYVELNDIPKDLIERTKYILLDGIGETDDTFEPNLTSSLKCTNNSFFQGCALVGANLPWSRILTESVLAMEGEGKSTVIGWGFDNVHCCLGYSLASRLTNSSGSRR